MTFHKADYGKIMDWHFWLFPTVVSILLIIISRFNFLAFHTLAELFTIIISFSLFAFAWWTRKLNRNHFLLFIACGYFWIGIIDLMHSLTYKGMDVFIAGSADLAVHFWLFARFMEAFLLLAAPFFALKRFNAYFVFYLYGIICFLMTILIFKGALPTTFIEGVGLTSFKIYSEYLIDVILALAMYFLLKGNLTSSNHEKLFISFAIIFTMLAELAFTFYVSVYGFSNLVGHIFKLFSFWFIFQAIVVINMQKPYSTLRKSENRFKNLFENTEVSIWEEDFTELIDELELIREQGITDLSAHLDSNNGLAWQLANKIHVVNVNDATLKLFKVSSREGFINKIETSFGDDAIDFFINSLFAIWNKHKSFRSEARFKASDGEEINAIVSYQLPVNYEGFSSVPVSIIDITQQKKQEELIRHQANFDFLTGLANRNLFSDRLAHALDLAVRNNSQLAVLFLDLDGFKHINDSKGHAFGDQLLQMVAERIVKNVRKSDTVARFGGDEFAILLPESHLVSDIEEVVVKILNSVSKAYVIKNIEAYVTTCIGITIYPNDGEDTATLLRKADSAMYKAKNRGANNFQFFTQKMDAEAHKRMVLEQALRVAIKNEDFTVYFQPVIDVINNKVIYAEALIRWQTKEMGMISPAEFIPLAEELGLINEIGKFVLRESCKHAMLWHRVSDNFPGVAVNLSSKQFVNQEIVALVENILLETSLPVEKLTLEITEGLLMQEEYAPLEQLEQLCQMGIKLSMDDFGTGYSSLSYLKRFPLTTLKIDRSFISGLPEDNENGDLVKAIMLMAKSLGLKVVAEGVELESQQTFLQNIGCKYIQGYLYSEPLSAPDFTLWYEKNMNG